MRTSLFRTFFFRVLFLLSVFVAHGTQADRAAAQAHPTPLPAPAQQPVTSNTPWLNIDTQKLDRAQCEAQKKAPLTCPDADAGALCRSIKETVDVKCDIILKPSFFEFIPKEIREKFIEYASQIALALFALFAATATAWLKARTEAAKSNEKVVKLENRVLDPFFERPHDFEQYATNMILIGEGGSGKTALLHAISGADEAQPDIATPGLSTYTLVIEISIERNGQTLRRLFRIYSDDYRGQSWVEGIQNPRIKERQKFVPSSTLVVVVDLVAPGSLVSPASRHDRLQDERVKKQLAIYNEPAIQTLANLVGPYGQIVLFINKADLIYPLTDEKVAEAKTAYAPLIALLSQVNGIKLRVIIGSAVTGMGIVGYADGHEEQKGLLKLLMDHSEKIDINKMKEIRDGNQPAS